MVLTHPQTKRKVPIHVLQRALPNILGHLLVYLMILRYVNRPKMTFTIYYKSIGENIIDKLT
jgi:hypothetical protein